ncbi:hypothetical protein [Candidatus Korarchaeum cryptofilum]|uniref:hypothetical protein n=1 Tax=Candidatus Korarchaeum cryptofilum TaxID=498846 RepID=UPI0016500A6F|nr:hypothetical protein [Candidatus Korarchaeum cryptofilum]
MEFRSPSKLSRSSIEHFTYLPDDLLSALPYALWGILICERLNVARTCFNLLKALPP